MSSSATGDLRAWARERFSPRRFGPLALLLALAASAGGGRPRLHRLGRDALLAALLLLQFRLWDDLADVPRDRVEHPERVLCRMDRHGPFRAAVAGLAGASALALARPRPAFTRLFGLAALNAGFLFWYRRARTAAGAYVVLLKYPAFVALLRGPDRPVDAALALAAAGVYLTLCTHEWLDDSGGDRHAGSRGEPDARTAAIGARAPALPDGEPGVRTAVIRACAPALPDGEPGTRTVVIRACAPTLPDGEPGARTAVIRACAPALLDGEPAARTPGAVPRALGPTRGQP